eukprot:NODE_1207_length_1641_cov_37.612437_g1072_i0.p1 GENE.NODE_1207_length_1641_cov_37.612437_g1072_i0~~NODE_1207_length_1641_cov_37.612437_g1072_i0.p1  ORF type:complete len:467 (+),score=88.03 NODE_1207_length_1641_cov_37.612437_g1072_i0:58-1458(+)
MDLPCAAPNDRVLACMNRVYKYRLTTSSGGNISMLDEEGTFWITPSGLDKGALSRSDICSKPKDGDWRGPRASSETPVHMEIYRRRDDVRAVLHAHPNGIVSYASAQRIPELKSLFSSFNTVKSIAYAEYRCPGTNEFADLVASKFEAGHNCVLLENHAVFVGGADLSDCFRRFEAMEWLCRVLLRAAQLGKPYVLQDGQIQQRLEYRQSVAKRVPPQHQRETSAKAEELQSLKKPISAREAELRRELCAIVQRSVKQQILSLGLGTFSLRVSETSCLITPAEADREALEEEDLILVEFGMTPGSGSWSPSHSRRASLEPNHSVSSHIAVYQKHAWANAIIAGYPVNATAYAVCREPFRSSIIPESHITLLDVHRVPFEATHGPEDFAGRFDVGSPIGFIDNDGVFVTGASLREAFDRLEVLEAMCEVAIQSRAIGSVVLMQDKDVQDIEEKFLGRIYKRQKVSAE